MRMLDRTSAERFLSEQGVQPASEVKNVLSGFDFSKAIYEHDFWPGDVVYQFVRLPSATDPAPSSGSWFGLAGLTPSGVAINEGLAGRRLARFKVLAPFKALEGTAVKFKINISSGIGGRGGATQIFIPRGLVGHLQSLGVAERW